MGGQIWGILSIQNQVDLVTPGELLRERPYCFSGHWGVSVFKSLPIIPEGHTQIATSFGEFILKFCLGVNQLWLGQNPGY